MKANEIKANEIKANEINAKDEIIKGKDRELNSKDEIIAMLKVSKEQETLYKFHYQKLLTVRGIIEMFEKKFGQSKNKSSRKENWKKYLLNNPANLKPFEEAGFNAVQVAEHIDSIFKSSSADIHTIKQVENLVLKVGEKLSPDELRVLSVIITASGWESIIEIGI